MAVEHPQGQVRHVAGLLQVGPDAAVLPQLKALGECFLSAAAGAPCHGLVTSPQPQHAGMCFSSVQLQAVVGDVTEALVEQGVGAVEVGEVVALFHAGNDSRTRAA